MVPSGPSPLIWSVTLSPLPLRGVAHHGDAGERTAERRGGDGAGVVDLAGALGERTGVDGRGLDHAVFGHGPH